ncbi:apo-citrate lyase phosphoribosyl-dephospho-CoA transferase [Ligilactobacillus salitolerans]|uniref:citrate lyase holo-[acyl-carrier protein] synthase n=1 Tax=Ligilactobacillus salitolerans TaxID=1808352 RepID=A0A401IUN2_9LACO|nr:citrate lyase holo-[acyl-carrier protein] synthase [Ligilactobacillus salitolerans]GBG95251.1 apo-citrate lyase phosphoribosyl-dephospho-CoA transferase [Ligilactobacillus salitolerans]
MVSRLFATGQPQTIQDVLANKDRRAARQGELCSRFPEQTIVNLKLNIPGPIKNNPELQEMFNLGSQELLNRLLEGRADTLIWQNTWDEPTGDELFLVLDQDLMKVKQLTTKFEEEFELGRLFDADVLSQQTQDKPVSRSVLGLPSRKCFICSRPAKECARSRRHSVEDLQQAISLAWAQLKADN